MRDINPWRSEECLVHANFVLIQVEERGIANAIDRTKRCQLQPGRSLGLALLANPISER